MAKRVFYVVYFEDRRLQRTLDAIRLICDPSEKTRAHITIRGPYAQRYDVRGLENQIRGSKILAFGVDHFFNERQNTVFLRCDSPTLRNVSNKKDFGYNPHITLYDGRSREFARKLVEELAHVDISFSFIANALSPLVSHQGQQSFQLRESFDEEFVATLLAKRLTLSEVDTVDSETRVRLVATLAKRLRDFGAPMTGEHLHAAQQCTGADRP